MDNKLLDVKPCHLKALFPYKSQWFAIGNLANFITLFIFLFDKVTWPGPVKSLLFFCFACFYLCLFVCLFQNNCLLLGNSPVNSFLVSYVLTQYPSQQELSLTKRIYGTGSSTETVWEKLTKCVLGWTSIPFRGRNNTSSRCLAAKGLVDTTWPCVVLIHPIGLPHG